MSYSSEGEAPDVDKAMQDALHWMKFAFGEDVVDHYHGTDMFLASIAISLNRIVSSMDVMRIAAAALNDITYQQTDALKDISKQVKLLDGQLRENRSALNITVKGEKP